MQERDGADILLRTLFVEAAQALHDTSALGDIRIADEFTAKHQLIRRPLGWRETGERYAR